MMRGQATQSSADADADDDEVAYQHQVCPASPRVCMVYGNARSYSAVTSADNSEISIIDKAHGFRCCFENKMFYCSGKIAKMVYLI